MYRELAVADPARALPHAFDPNAARLFCGRMVGDIFGTIQSSRRAIAESRELMLRVDAAARRSFDGGPDRRGPKQSLR
jgi:hypothetical protein